MINIQDFDMAAIYAAYRQAKKAQLTLCINRIGGWASEPADHWIEGQILRLAEPKLSRADVEDQIKEAIAALNEEESLAQY